MAGVKGGGPRRRRVSLEAERTKGGQRRRQPTKERKGEHRVGPASRTYLQCSPVSQITDKCVSRCPVLHARIKSRRLIYKTDPPASTLSGEQLLSECDGEHAMTFLGRVSARPLLSQPPRPKRRVAHVSTQGWGWGGNCQVTQSCFSELILFFKVKAATLWVYRGLIKK